MRSTLRAIWFLVPDPFSLIGPFGFWFLTLFAGCDLLLVVIYQRKKHARENPGVVNLAKFGWAIYLTAKAAVDCLLFLFDVPSVFAKSRAVLLQTQFFATWLTFQRVVDVARFFAD